MAKWGKVNYDEFKKLRDNLENMDEHRQAFFEDCARELAARLLGFVIPRTPVQKTVKEDGKTVYTGGTLRRGWTARNHTEAEQRSGQGGKRAGEAHGRTLDVEYANGNYTITVINPVNYASYVEFGHRTRDHMGWVQGQYFLTVSEKQLQRWIASGGFEKKLQKFLKQAFDGM